MKAKADLQLCCDDMRSWASKPLFIRKDNNNEALLDISNTDKLLDERLLKCYESKKLIDKIVNDGNFRLFFDVAIESCHCSSDSETDVGTEDEENESGTVDGEKDVSNID